jgi:hypothetical protein
MAATDFPTQQFLNNYWQNSSDDLRCRSGINNNVFVAVLIATVTFSAPFTVADNNPAAPFLAFLYFDAAAFAASMLAVLYAITCFPYSTAVADAQIITLTRIIYFAIYFCVGAFCASVFMVVDKVGQSIWHPGVITVIVSAIFVASLIPACMWFFCDHTYISCASAEVTWPQLCRKQVKDGKVYNMPLFW